MTVRPRRALIVDNDPQTRERTVSVLSNGGFTCETAEDGERALELLSALSYDLLVADLVLPKLHGHAVVVAAQMCSPAPKIVVLTNLTDSRVVRDLLSRGVDDYMHKSTPTELLGVKVQSLFDVDAWQMGRNFAAEPSADSDLSATLEGIERRLQVVSEHYADTIGRLLEGDCKVPDIPPGVMAYVERLSTEERAALQAGIVIDANTRSSQRVEMRSEALAIQLDEHRKPMDAPIKVVIRDISATGIKLMHTRAIPATDMVISWQAETMPYCTLCLPVRITRCRPSGRFYDIGGQFDIPAELAEQARQASGEEITATS